MGRVILQVPMDDKLKTSAEKVAKEYGFSSLQEVIRFLTKKLSNKEIKISVTQEEMLFPDAEARYEKMLADIKSGKEKVYTANSVEELLNHLHGNKNSVQ